MSLDRQKVYRVIALATGAPIALIRDDVLFAADLGLDHLDCMEVVLFAEEEFGITITDADCEAIPTVGDLVALIERKIGGAAC